MKTIKLIILAALCMLVPQGCTFAMRGHGKKNGRNVPKRVVPPRGTHHGGGGAVRRPVNEGVNVPSLDAFVANFTPEEIELNFGHTREVNPPIQEVREVITPVVPVVDHQEQARAAERARASAELFERVKNAGNSTSVDFKDLLGRGADINGYHNGLTPLVEAVRQGNLPLCESLIAHGGNVNLPFDERFTSDLPAGVVTFQLQSWTPLLISLFINPFKRGMINIIKLLVKSGADVNACALMKLSWDNGRNEVVWFTPLLNVLARNDVETQIYLYLNALAGNDIELRTYLLEQGAQVNIHNNMARAEGRIIPLIQAAEQYDGPLCQELLQAGADARFQNSDGVSIWQIACNTRQAHLCELLIKVAQFLPSEEEVVASFNRVKATLLFFNRNKCCFPRDIQRMVLLKAGLKNDIMTVMFDRVQRGKAIPEFFGQLILSWLQEYKIEQLKNGMRPVYELLMAQDNHSDNDARFIGLLDPDTLVPNFGDVITESIVKRFGPKEEAQPAQDPEHKE